MILRKDLVQQIKEGLAQIEVEKTEEHNEMIAIIFPLRKKYESRNMSSYFKYDNMPYEKYSAQEKPFLNLPIIHASDIILDNTVIKVESEEHGKRVIAWWKEQGVDVRGNNGCIIGDYYGLYNGEFYFHSEGYVKEHSKKIITLPEPFPSKQETKQENKMRTITWQAGQSIIDIACVDWKGKLFDTWARPIVMKEPIEIKDSFYQEMRKACTKEQNELFDKIFGKEKEEIDLVHGKGIDDFIIFDGNADSRPNSMIALRYGGKFKQKSFCLSSYFNWSIETDEYGYLCLIPTNK